MTGEWAFLQLRKTRFVCKCFIIFVIEHFSRRWSGVLSGQSVSCTVNDLKNCSVGLYLALRIVTSCCGCHTACWRPAYSWLGWGSMSLGDPGRSQKGGSGGYKTFPSSYYIKRLLKLLVCNATQPVILSHNWTRGGGSILLYYIFANLRRIVANFVKYKLRL